MTKHAADTASTTKKYLAAAGLALGMGSLGLFASAGTATADNYYDVWDLDGTEGAKDVGVSPEVEDRVVATYAYDTSSYPADSSWPAGPEGNFSKGS